MNPYEIIDKYYPENTEQRQILVIHSLSVTGKAMKYWMRIPNYV